MQKNTLVIESNIHFLNQGIELLSNISNEQYAFNNGQYFKSGVGRHFRHIIEHYLSLLNVNESKVNYDDRERDLKLETNREFTIQTLQDIVKSLSDFKTRTEELDTSIMVMSNEGIGEENTPWSSSSIRRELQFLISHTVHHYALIGLILKTIDVPVTEEFGIAPSTLKHEAKQKETAQAS